MYQVPQADLQQRKILNQSTDPQAQNSQQRKRQRANHHWRKGLNTRLTEGLIV